MRNRFFTLMALGLSLAACAAEDGKDGTDGAAGADGADGASGADGANGADGADGDCAGATPVEITGITNLPTDTIDAFYPSDTLTVETNAPGELTYTIIGYGVDYDWSGDDFTVTATTGAPSSQIIVGTDGCSTATYEFSIDAEVGTSLVNIIHLYDGAPLVDVTLSGDDVENAILTDFGVGTETGYLPLDSMPYTFDVWASGAVAATLPTIEPQPDGVYTVVVYSDSGAPTAMVIEDDVSEVATEGAARVRATHVADGVGQVDIWETVLGAALFENLDFGATSDSADIITGEYTLGIDADDDASVDYDFQAIDITGLEGVPVNAYAYLRGTTPFIHVSMPAYDAYTTILPDPLPAPSTTATGSSTPASEITGFSTTLDTIEITDACTVLDLTVNVDITHAYRGDMEIVLWAPDGTDVWLHNNSGGSADDLIGSYAMDGTGTLTAEGDLDDFLMTRGTGEWTLDIYDTFSADDGVLNSWDITLGCL